MSAGNPYQNLMGDKTGSTIEILESLTDKELDTYVLYLEWEQQHRVFDHTNTYKSRSCYAY